MGGGGVGNRVERGEIGGKEERGKGRKRERGGEGERERARERERQRQRQRYLYVQSSKLYKNLKRLKPFRHNQRYFQGTRINN